MTYTLEIGSGDVPATGDFGQFNLPGFPRAGIPDEAITSGDELIIRFRPEAQLPRGTLTWHVKSVDGAGNSGDFSGAITFSVVADVTLADIPELLTPASGDRTADTTPTFEWTEVTDLSGVSYTLEIASGDQPATGAFTNPQFSRDGLSSGAISVASSGDIQVVQFTLPVANALTVDGDYIWHVRSVDGAGNSSEFSGPFIFTIDTTGPPAPTLVFPGTGDTADDTTPEFVWTRVVDAPSSGVVTYTIEIDSGDQPTTGAFITPDSSRDGLSGDDISVVSSGDVQVVRFTLPDANPPSLEVDRDYIWHVRAVDGLGNPGDFSDRAAFTIVPDTTAPLAPELRIPVSGVTADSARPLFTWTQVADSSGVAYTLEIGSGDQPATGEQGQFLAPVSQRIGILDQPISGDGEQRIQFRPDIQLPGGTLSWHVRAVDGSGNLGPFSTADTFTVIGTPKALTMEPFESQFASSGDPYTPLFRWKTVPLAVNYEVSLDNGLFQDIGDNFSVTGDFIVTTAGDLVGFGSHHVFQVRAVGTGSTPRGGIATLFFSENVTSGDVTSFTVSPGDFLPLGKHIIQVSALDTLGNASDPEDAQLLFNVSQLAISILPSTQTRVSDQTTTVTVNLNPRGQSVDGALIAIDFDTNLLSFASISTGDKGGIEITGIDTGSGTRVDFVATFDTLLEDEPPLDLASIQFLTKSQGTAIIGLVSTDERKTVGRFENRDIPAVLQPATVIVVTPTPKPPPPPPPPPPEPPPPAPGNVAPAAVAGPDQTVNEGDTVNLTGAGSSDPEGAALTFSWAQTPGPTVTLAGAGTATPSFVAVDDGSLTFELTVTDPDGLTGTATVVVTVNNVAPVVIAGADQNVVAFQPATVTATFTDPGTVDTHTATIQWDDGTDDTTVSIALGDRTLSADHTYTQGGVFNVTITVADDDLGSASVSLNVEVAGPPTAVIDAPASGDEGSLLVFNGSASFDSGTSIAQHLWGFGDGRTGDGITVTHVYSDNRIFTVTLTVVDDDGLTDDDSASVTVNNVAPTVVPGDNQTANESDAVTIIASVVSPFSETHVYTDNGTRTVVVRVIDKDGGVGSGTLRVTADNVSPTVNAGPGQIVFVDDVVSFSGTIDDPGTDDTHTVRWDFGDGTGVTVDLTPTHTYTGDGEFTVTFTAIDDDGGFGTDTLTVRVLVRVAAIAGIEVRNFALSTTEPVPPEPVVASFDLVNITAAPLTVSFDLRVNGVPVDPDPFTDITVPALGSVPLEHTIRETAAKFYAVQLLGQRLDFVIRPARLVAVSLNVSPRVAFEFNRIEIQAIIENRGAVFADELVNISIDGRFPDLHRVRLGPTQSILIVRAVNVLPPFVGEVAPGPRHTVEVLGQTRLYIVVRRKIDVPVRTRHTPDPGTRVATPGGQLLELAPGDVVIATGGSITLRIPVRAGPTVRVGSFVDTVSGISIVGKKVEVPVRDPGTDEILLRLVGELKEVMQGTAAGDAATGIFDFLNLVTEEKSQDLSVDDPLVGRFGTSLKASLEVLPPATQMRMAIKKELKDEDLTQVEGIARVGGQIVANQAGTVTVETPGLTEEHVGPVEITTKVSANWILEFGRRNVRVAHVKPDGDVEILVPVCTGPDSNFDFTCVATTTRGFSEFSLLALVDIPAEFLARNLVITPAAVEPGQSVVISVDVVNEGVSPGSFSTILKIKRPDVVEFEPIAVKGVTLEGGEERTVRFFVAREEEGRYVVEIEGRTGEFLTGAFDVFRKLDPAVLSFTPLVITPELVRPGEPVQISMFVVNAGGDDGRTEVELRINNVLTEIRSLSVPGLGRVEVIFEFIPPAEGAFNIELIDPEELVNPVTGIVEASLVIPALFVLVPPVDVRPLEVFPEGELTISFDLTNEGGEAGTRTVVLLVDGKEIDRQEVSVEALFIESVTFVTTAPLEPGTYSVRIEIPEDPEVVTIESAFKVVERIESVVVERLAVEVDRVLAGQTVTVTVDVTNVTDEIATRTLVLKLDGVVVEERLVTLNPREKKTEIFEFAAPEVIGTHEVVVAELPPLTFRVITLRAVLNLVQPLNVIPSTVEPGDVVTIRAVLENEGEEAGDSDVILKINGVEVEKKTVLVQPKSKEAVEFQVTRIETGDYMVEVEAVDARDVTLLRGSFTVRSLLILVPDSVKVDRESVKSGEPVIVSVVVRNEGLAPGSRTVVLSVDGVLIEKKTVTLGPDEFETVTFSPHVERDVGEHTVNVDGIITTFTVTEKPSFPVIILVLIIVGLLVAGLAGVVLYFKKIRRAAPPEAI